MDDGLPLVAIGLGSNLGDRRVQLETALDALAGAVSIRRLASLYETEPVGEVQQPAYLNSAVVVATRLEPEPLLAVLKSIEQHSGRLRGRRWGPRVLDLDLLIYGGRVARRPELTLPHPRLTSRRFVLEALAEIAPGLPIPPTGRTALDLAASLAGQPAPRCVAAASPRTPTWA